ncbi:MAG TPA: DUF805 domain-containing protein [Dongiaceae bacterium]|jgi:uncharacterized membrane protein YhaH (DUF805 family)
MDKIAQFFRRYLWISGRSTRAEWWLVHFLATIVLVKNEMALLDQTAPGPNGQPLLVVPFTWVAINFLLLWISFTSIVRRLHDRNKSGWWAALYLLPFVGWVWLVVECGFLPGRPSRWAAEDPEPVVAPEIEEEPAPEPAVAPVRRVGTIQRVEYRPWNGKLLMKIARNAVGLILGAIVIYHWLHALPADIDGTFEIPGKMNSIE